MRQKMMSIWTVLLLLFAVTPAGATEIPGSTPLFSTTIPTAYKTLFAVSSKNKLLVARLYEEYDEQRGDTTYVTDLYIVDDTETKKSLTLTNVEVTFVERSDAKVFLVAVNDDGTGISIYNEAFQLVKQHTLQNVETSSRADVYAHERYVRVAFLDGASFIYDLNTLLTTDVELNVTEVVANGDEVQLVDALGQVKQTISYKDVIQQQQYKRAFIDGDSIALGNDRITFAYMQEESFMNNGFEDSTITWYVVTTDYNGQVLHKDILPTATNSYDVPQFVVTKTMYNIFTHSSEDEGYTYVRTYNPQTGALSSAEPFSQPFDYIWEKRDDYFFAPVGGDKMMAYQTSNLRPLYALEQALLYDLSDDYGIIEGGAVDESYNAFHFTLFDVHSGKTVKTLKANNLQFVQHDFFVEKQVNEEESQQTLVLHQLHTNNIRPTTYAPSKMWTVTFNDTVDANTISANTVYVTNAQQVKQPVTLRVSGKQVFIDAPSIEYAAGNYQLHIDGVRSKNGLSLKEAKTHAFTIAP